jgi:hypothetical protein
MENSNNNEITSYLDWSDKGKSSLWRYLAGFLLSVFVFFSYSPVSGCYR